MSTHHASAAGHSMDGQDTDASTLDPYSRNLGRGKACTACRRRKLRCDGGRPSCNRCLEARARKMDAMRRKGKSEEEIHAIRFPPCYTEGEAGDESTGSTSARPSTSAAAAAAAGNTVSSTARSSSNPLTPEDQRPSKIARTAGSSASAAASGSSNGLLSGGTLLSSRLEPQATTQNDLFFAEILSSHLPLESASRTPSTDQYSQSLLSQSGKERSSNGGARGGIATSYWLQDTDLELPELPLLSRLIEVFYEEYYCSPIFHPLRLRERIALGPHHTNYPAKAAMHIIVSLAYAARPDIDEEVCGGAKPTFRTGAHYQHFCAAQQSLMNVIHCDRNMSTLCNSLDIVRASLLFVFKTFGQGDELEAYLAIAQAARLCIAVNMNRDVPPRRNNHELAQLQTLLMQPRIADASVIRPEPSDDIEAEEVRRTMALMFLVDRTGCAATLWPPSLTEEDYTAELPRATLREFLSTTTANVDAQEWTQRRNTLSLNSSDFLSRRAADAEMFVFKVNVLLGRCALYVSRLSRTATPDQIVSASRFQQLESWIASMHLESQDVLNMSAKMTSPYGGSNGGSGAGVGGVTWASRKVEGSLVNYLLEADRNDFQKGMIITSALVPFACTLTLHEPLANLSQESEARCKAATRGAINILRLCAAHSEGQMQRLDVSMTIIVMLIGRSLIRQLESLYSKYIAQEMAQSSGDVTGNGGAANGGEGDSVWNSEDFNESVSLLQADLEVVLLTLKRFGDRWVMAIKMHDSLLKMLQFNPEHRLRGLFCVE